MGNTDKRKEVWKKANGRCAHCGRLASGNQQTIDHFIPKSVGGGYDIRNLMPLCRRCNEDKLSVEVTAGLFYPYATKEAIADCKSYKADWIQMRTNATGEVFCEL